jgi:hypothetical protein
MSLEYIVKLLFLVILFLVAVIIALHIFSVVW